jgi:rod shape-determining protein MreB
VAVDLGTANVRVFAHGRGLVADDPSIVRMRRESHSIVSVGSNAGAGGEAGGASFPVHPMRKGVVRDVECAGWLLSAMLRRAGGLSLVRPAVLACAPSDATGDEIESLREALRRAGAARVTIIPEPLAAAVGAGLDMASEHAQMIVDVGEGVTDVAVLRDGLIEAAWAVRVGCSDLRSAVADHLLRAGVGMPSPAAIDAMIRRADAAGADGSGGRALLGIREAMAPVVEAIATEVRAAWGSLAPGASCEVIEGGIWLTGGGACLRVITEGVARVTAIDVHVPANPLHAVITGASRIASSEAGS